MARCREDLPLDDLELGVPETALVTRPDAEVEVRTLLGGGAVFFQYLLAGNTLGTAAAASTNSDPQFDLPAAIAALIKSGAFTSAELKPAQNIKGAAK